MNTTHNQDTTQPMPTFRSLFVPGTGMPEPRRRYPRDTASLAVTQRIPVR